MNVACLTVTDVYRYVYVLTYNMYKKKHLRASTSLENQNYSNSLLVDAYTKLRILLPVRSQKYASKCNTMCDFKLV